MCRVCFAHSKVSGVLWYLLAYSSARSPPHSTDLPSPAYIIPEPSLCIFLSFKRPVMKEFLCMSHAISQYHADDPQALLLLCFLRHDLSKPETTPYHLYFFGRALPSCIRTSRHSKLSPHAHLRPRVPRHDVVSHVPENPHAPEDRNQSKEQRKGCH